jgi:hypothetical protein
MNKPCTLAGDWSELFKDQPDLFSNTFIFTRKMEKKVVYMERGE